MLGSRAAAITTLGELVAATQADLAQLRALPAGDESGRRQLLHRMEGALSLARGGDVLASESDEHHSLQERERAVEQHLHVIERALGAVTARTG